MTQRLEGLQFSLDPNTHSQSTTYTCKAIISEALSLVDHQSAMDVLKEKNWRKQYPHYFKCLVEHSIRSREHSIQIAEQGLHKAQHSFDFYRNGERYMFKNVMQIDSFEVHTVKIQGLSQNAPEWYIPYGKYKLSGQALIEQLDKWVSDGIIEHSHAKALKMVQQHPEWLDLSDRHMVLFGAGSEAGPLQWLAKWKANIIAIDLPNEKIWQKIINTVQQGNATLYAPSLKSVDPDATPEQLAQQLGVNLLTHIPELGHWLGQMPHQLDLAAIAYLDGEKHVRVSMAMDSIMSYISKIKADTSLMYMCTPTDIYAIPQQVLAAAEKKFAQRSTMERILSSSIAKLSLHHFFKKSDSTLITADNHKAYGITDCMVVEQGPNYALAKRLQQWRATLARNHGQQVSINIAPSTTTHSVTKSPLLKAAFQGAKLFDVEAFEPETTNAMMAALWVHDLCNPQALANPKTTLEHPLELMMDGANHGGLWRVGYLARTALPFAALYGMGEDKLNFKRTKK